VRFFSCSRRSRISAAKFLSAWDFEAVEIFDTSRLGHGDWGTFTATWNETYMADVDIQTVPDGKRFTAVWQVRWRFPRR